MPGSPVPPLEPPPSSALPRATGSRALAGGARRLRRAVLRRLASATASQLPEAALARLAAARAWRSGLVVGLPPCARALALAPHPDDESLASGGTLARLTDEGAQVTLVAITDGEASLSAAVSAADLARRRRAELRTAAALLGIGDVRFLGYPDGGLHTAREALATQLRGLLVEVQPEIVLLPWAGDDPGDHAALNLALADATPEASVQVWGGEIWTPVPANRLVDITGVLERKRAAIAAHATAFGAFDLEALLGLNRYRSIRGLRGRGSAEAFLVCSGERYPALVAAVLGP